MKSRHRTIRRVRRADGLRVQHALAARAVRLVRSEGAWRRRAAGGVASVDCHTPPCGGGGRTTTAVGRLCDRRAAPLATHEMRSSLLTAVNASRRAARKARRSPRAHERSGCDARAAERHATLAFPTFCASRRRQTYDVSVWSARKAHAVCEVDFVHVYLHVPTVHTRVDSEGPVAYSHGTRRGVRAVASRQEPVRQSLVINHASETGSFPTGVASSAPA